MVEQTLYRQLLQDRQRLYTQALNDSRLTPFVYPWDTIPVAILIGAIAFCPSLPKKFARPSQHALTACSIAYSLWRWNNTRTLGFASGYGLGLTACWGIVATINLLVFHDPAQDFKRQEIVPKAAESSSNTKLDSTSNDIAGLRHRKVANARSSGTSISATSLDSETTNHQLRWTSYSSISSLYHKLDWSIDLMTSFRGPNWNWRIRMLPDMPKPPDSLPPPSNISFLGLLSNSPPPCHKNYLLVNSLRTTAITYLLIDAIKCVVVTDPYFLGISPIDSPTPWTFLGLHRLGTAFSPISSGLAKFILKFVRLNISLLSVVLALSYIFSLAPFFIYTLPTLLFGHQRTYKYTSSPILEQWMYQPQWGDFYHDLSTRGIAGWWGGWWHKMFTFGISVPAQRLCSLLGIDGKSQTGRLLQITVAFGLTASLHAAASSTTFSIIPSRPQDPFLFFLLQGVGVIVQTSAAKWLNKLAEWPVWVRKAGNLMVLAVWAWYIGPLLCDDFARAGVWLFEPVPVSILGLLGLGGKGRVFVPWWDDFGVERGGRWAGFWPPLGTGKWPWGIAFY